MNTNIQTDSVSQGLDEIPALPAIETIEKYLARDLQVVATLIDAILRDKELRNVMATFLHGRYQNHLNKIDPQQTDLFKGPKPTA